MGCATDGRGNFMCKTSPRKIQLCRFCGEIATALCDYPMGDGKTCDLPLCDRHRIKQGAEWQDIDFCPTHEAMVLRMERADEA